MGGKRAVCCRLPFEGFDSSSHPFLVPIPSLTHLNHDVSDGASFDLCIFSPGSLGRQHLACTACRNNNIAMPSPPLHSLVKYDTPSLLTTKDKKPVKGAKGGAAKKLPPVEAKQALTPTEDILNSILPPREWTEEGQLWVQYVSSTPATRLDVINLQESLDHRLLQRQARETGICPVREELYAQCFDELIREVTITCAERGLLLLRVRDEIRMTIAAYQTLYESSIAFGMRKALMAEYKKTELESNVKQLESEREELSNQVADLTQRCEDIAGKEVERRAADEAKHTEDVEKLKGYNLQLKTNLGTMLSAPQRK